MNLHQLHRFQLPVPSQCQEMINMFLLSYVNQVDLECPYWLISLQWCYNDHDDISNNQCLDCLLRHRSNKTSKLCVTGLCERNWLVTNEFPTQRASIAANVSILWNHHFKPIIILIVLSLVFIMGLPSTVRIWKLSSGDLGNLIWHQNQEHRWVG